MRMSKPPLLLAAIMSFGLAAGPAHAELNAPKLGTRMVWDCEGPYSQRYDLTVVRIEKDVVRYEGQLDGAPFFSEKHARLTGTSLWYELSGDRAQWFDMEDFEDFHKLVPGSRFKGAVPAQKGLEKWVWDYEVSVGQPQDVKHGVLGAVRLVPVSEERKIFHGTYWSRMTTFLQPKTGVSVSWTYEDSNGIELCDLISLER